MDLSKLKEAETLIRAGKLDRAKKELLRFTRKHPHATDAWVMLASVCGQTGCYREVIDACQKAIAIAPHHHMAQSLMGSACVALNRYNEAIGHLQRANELVPGNPAITNNLGNAYYAQGKTGEAEHWFQATLKVVPSHPQANFGMGNCCLANARWGDAVVYYRKAYHAMADDYHINMSLGKAYANLARVDEAMECLQRATKLIDQPNVAYLELARLAQLQGQLGRAEGYIEQSLQHQANNTAARAEQAEIQYKLGNIDRAHQQIRALMNEGHSMPAVALTWGQMCHRFGECGDVIALTKAMLDDDRLPKSDTISLHYLLGKLYDKADEFDNAFAHYDQANSILPGNFDRANHKAIIDSLIGDFSKECFSSLPHTNCTDERPVFIVGMPRSGTSLAEQILSSHPAVFGAGELNDIKVLASELFRGSMGGKMNRFMTADEPTLSGLANRYLSVIGEAGGSAKRVTDKMPTNFLWLGFIMQLFPKAQIIHCRRDPRDSCLSIFFQQFSKSHDYANDLSDLAFFYRQYERLMTHWQAELELPILDIDYANLVSDLEGCARRMVDYVRLEWDPQCLNFHTSARAAATASWDQVREPIYTKSLHRWKNYRAHLGPLLEEFGDDDMPLGPRDPANRQSTTNTAS